MLATRPARLPSPYDVATGDPRRRGSRRARPRIEGQMQEEDDEQRGHEGRDELQPAAERADGEEQRREREVLAEEVGEQVRDDDPEDRDQRVEDVADEKAVLACSR